MMNSVFDYLACKRRAWFLVQLGLMLGLLFGQSVRAQMPSPFWKNQIEVPGDEFRVLGNQINNSGTSSQASERASVTGEPTSLPASLRSTSEWFNTAAFRLPEPGDFGNAGRNTVDGPGAWVVNMNLSRSIPFNDEGRRLLITLRGSNLFNHPNFGGVSTVVNSTAFGQVVSVGTMRRIQLNLRFMF